MKVETGDLKARVWVLEDRRKLLVKYATDRLEAEDWHGLQDAGSDLRELDTELRVLKGLLKTPTTPRQD